jgi:hypothetical protein
METPKGLTRDDALHFAGTVPLIQDRRARGAFHVRISIAVLVVSALKNFNI